MASGYNFNNWSEVEDVYGNGVVQQLQQNNVPLDQVSAVIGAALPGETPVSFQGGGGPNFNGQGFAATQGLAQYFGQQGGQGGQQQQGPSFDPTQNPNYPTSLLGAQALQAVGLNPNRQVTVNPSPENTPSSGQFAQSGVSAVASPETVQYAKNTPMPQTTQAPSIFSPAQALPNTGASTVPLQPSWQYNTAELRGQGTGKPFAAVPPTTTPPPAPGVPSPFPSAAGAATVGAATGATIGAGGGQILGFNHGTGLTGGGNTTPTPGMNAPSPNQGAQQKLLAGLPHYQDGGIAGMDGPEVAVLGEAGPEAVTPLTDAGTDAINDPSFAQIGTQMPIGQNAPGFDSNLAYGQQQPQQPPQPQQTYLQPNQPPPAPTNAASGSLTAPGMQSFHEMPQGHQPADMYGQPAAQQQPQNPNQIGPQTPAPNPQTGVNMNQRGQPNMISHAANQAAQQAIKNLLGQASQIGKGMAGSKTPWSPIQSAIPQPPAAPGQVQMKPPPLTNQQNQNQSVAQQQAQLAAYYS